MAFPAASIALAAIGGPYRYPDRPTVATIAFAAHGTMTVNRLPSMCCTRSRDYLLIFPEVDVIVLPSQSHRSMQFVENGPDIPDDLVNDLMNDRAVFFCGAGVSRNAGLPDFKELACSAVDLLTGDPAAVASKHIASGRYDAAFQVVYDEVFHIDVARLLKENLTLSKQSNLKAHSTILGLAKNGVSGKTRLVTTNFDHGFSLAGVEEQDVAPRLPPVRRDWWTTVALHGQLENDSIDNIVLTSGQFGRAYLTEGWATRFVAELFRRFVVVFVGYSVDDPVMRYVVDSYRAVDPVEEMHTYAFVGSSKEKKDSVVAEWKSKHVEPIWYPVEDTDHKILYDSLEKLRVLKERGKGAPQMVLDKYCHGAADLLRGEEKTQVVWALRAIHDRRRESTSIGPPSAGVLATLSQRLPPSMESWIRLLCESGLEPESRLVRRWPRLGSEIRDGGAFDEHQAAGQWICTQLRSKPLIDWVISEGGFVSPVVAEVILPHIAAEEGPFERAWCFICEVALNPPYWTVNQNSLAPDALQSHSVDEKADALIATILPAIRLECAYLTGENHIESACDLLQAEIFLPVDQSPVHCVKRLLEDCERVEILRRAAHRLLARVDDLGKVIKRIQKGLGVMPYAVESDPDKLHRPPSVHRAEHAWRLIPFLVNKITDLLCETDRIALAERLRHWLFIPHSIVHARIAFRALSKCPLIEPGMLVSILDKSPNWLFDSAVRSHLRKVLSTYGGRLSSSHRETIGRLILKWSQIMNSDDLREFKARAAIKLLSALYGDTNEVLQRFPELSRYGSNSATQVTSSDGSYGYPGAKKSLSFDFTTEFFDAIARAIESDTIIRERFIDWTQTKGPRKAFALMERHFSDAVAYAALSGIARWLCTHQGATESAKRALSLIESVDELRLSSIVSVTIRALRGICGARRRPAQTRILRQIDRCIDLSVHPEESPPGISVDLVVDATNSDVGQLAESLMALLSKRASARTGSSRNDTLSRLAQLLTHSQLIRARVGLILGTHLAYVYVLDRVWSERHILPLLTDSEPSVRKYTWCGFLHNPRIAPPPLAGHLIAVLKHAIESTKEVEIAQPNLGRLPLFLHYYYPDKLNAETLKNFLNLMNPPTLAESIQGIVELYSENSHLADTGSKTWIMNALEKGFPKVDSCYGNETSLAFVELMVALEPFADEIIEIISSRLKPVCRLTKAIHLLREKCDFISNHPETLLRLVRGVADEHPPAWDVPGLTDLLEKIKEAAPPLTGKEDYRYLYNLTQDS